MKTKLLKSSDKNDFVEWRQLCDSMHECDIYFYPQYAKIYELNNEGEAYCFIYYKNENDFIIYPFLKRKINSLDVFKNLTEEYFDLKSPYGYGGYLRSKSCSIDMNFFLNFFHEFCKENHIIAEFIRFNPWLKTQGDCNGFLDVNRWNQVVVIDLTKSESDIWFEYDSKNRNRIRKSIKSNVVVKQDSNFNYLNEFIKLYHQTMGRKEALTYYYFDSQYFRNLIDFLHNNITLFHAWHEDKIIASLLVIFSNNYVHAHLLGSDQNYYNLAPCNLLFHEVAIWSKKQGFSLFCIGGGKTPSSNDTLFQFKKKFSKKYYDFCIGKKIHDKNVYELLCQKKVEYMEANDVKKLDENFFPKYYR